MSTRSKKVIHSIRHFKNEMEKIYNNRCYYSKDEANMAIKRAKTILRNLRDFNY